MVYLRKIETRGFKSMGTSLITVPVEKGFVAITGPNGSGKSNLIDAILFALGENSPKTLRAQSLSALIYDGSVEQQKPSSARVTLHFDNSDRRIPMDSDTVTITRELKQTGESAYTLNGKHAQRNNLGDLLENALIASRGLNIVLQGMITRISELVPDEKRKLIESMVGISQFDEKKQEALKQLAEADNKLNVAMAKIEEIRDKVRQLEQQRNDQLRHKQLENEIKWLRAASSSAKLVSTRKILAEKLNASDVSRNKFEQLLTSTAETGKTVSELEQQQTVLINSAVDAGTAKIEAELGKVTNELNALSKQRKEASDLIERMRQVLPRMSEMRAESETKISEAEARVVSLKAKIDEAEARRKDLSVLQSNILQERSALNSEFQQAQQAVNLVRKKKQEVDSRLEAKREEIREIVSRKKSAEDKLVQSIERRKSFDESLGKANDTIGELEKLLSSESEELSRLLKSRSDLDKLRKKLEIQLDIAAAIVEKTQTVVTKYDSNLAAMENVAGEEIALSRLETLGEAKAIRGYIGPLRSKISYDSDYSQAIAAVGKDWLSAVLVSDINALIATMQSAKKLKISKLTAIPLNEVADFDKSVRLPKLPGAVALVADVVKCEKRLRKVVNFVFGNAIIVDSSKNAFLAAKRGYRAVTLEGDLFEPELLAYQRGYSKKYAKLSELLAKQKNYEGIRLTLGAFRNLISKRKNSLQSLHQKSEASFKDEKSQDLSVAKIDAKLTAQKNDLARYLKSLEQLDQSKIKIQEEIESLAKSEIQSTESLNAIKTESADIESKLANLDLSFFDSKTSDINSRSLEINSQIEAVVQEIRDLTTDQTRARGELENSLRPGFERLLSEQSNAEIMLTNNSKLLVDTEPRLKELEDEHVRLKEEERKSLEISNRYKPLLDEIKVKLESLKINLEKTRRESTATEREVYSLGVDIERLQEKERQLSGELQLNGYNDPIPTFEGAEVILQGLSGEYDALKGNVNFLADRSYKEVFENYKYSSVRRNELEKERSAIVTFIETIETEKRKVFMEAFERIDRELRVIFNKITSGNAWLELENPESIFESGIFLMVQFPGKIPRDSGSVSGGEKTMSALSFILAIQAVFPSPFYVFDEVDAHLDSNYSGKLAEILAERSDRSQIIIVSLKDSVVSKAHSVIGVYMPQGATKIVRYNSPKEVLIPNEQQ